MEEDLECLTVKESATLKAIAALSKDVEHIKELLEELMADGDSEDTADTEEYSDGSDGSEAEEVSGNL